MIRHVSGRAEARSARLACRVLPALLVCVLACAVPVRAQDATFTAGASSTQVAVGEQFQVTYTLSGGSLKSHRDFRAPDMNANFLTLMGPSTSQQMQIINGRVSTSISWTYVLQPRTTGTFDIPSASINYDGQTMKTNPVRIKVVAGAPGSGGGATGQQQKKGKDESPDVNLGDNLFIRAIVDKRSVYIGEPVTVTYKLYSRVAFQLSSPIKLPRMVGFWSEDLESPAQLRPIVESYNGKQYDTYTLKKVVYFPTQSGDLSVEPFEINCMVQVKQKRKTGDDFYDRFFSDPFFDSYKNVQKTLLTEKIAVNVKPLPETGKPTLFRGAVGEYTMDAKIDRSRLKANESAVLKVTIRGEGNIKLLEEPLFEVPTGVDRFDPKIDEQIVRGSGVITGVKSFEYLLVPRYPGKSTIEPVEFSYFNPATKKYVTLRSKPFELDVAEGAAGAVTTAAQRQVEWSRKDVQPLRQLSAPLAPQSPAGTSAALMFGMYLLPFAAMIGGLAAKRRWDSVHGDVVGLRMRRASRIADKHLGRSRKFLEANNIDAYYLEIARALWGYIQNRLTLPTSETSIDAVVERMQTRGVDSAVIADMQAALTGIEFARYSPTRSSQSEMNELYTVAKTAIISSEQALRG